MGKDIFPNTLVEYRGTFVRSKQVKREVWAVGILSLKLMIIGTFCASQRKNCLGVRYSLAQLIFGRWVEVVSPSQRKGKKILTAGLARVRAVRLLFWSSRDPFRPSIANSGVLALAIDDKVG